ncbi:MAG: sterol desaturase family protein [Verrucomicrobia bacterium]|nr:sterol desaturase family protein [Cytophagales bacterium]
MDFNPVMLAIPFFFLAMGIEILIDRFHKTNLYRTNDTITNLSAGTSQQVIGIFLKVFTLGIYAWVFHNFAFFQVPDTWWAYILAFVLYDLCYYFAHRMSHEVNLFWTGHVVHHQSEEYNLSVALRQSWFQGVWTAPFYLPMALLGFSTAQLVMVGGINLIYQFWIHTELVNKMGFLEYFMNTPSHHRVHHGRNPKYIDKNHAGTFIIWDKLFGTFQAEEERPVYGITTPIDSWNPVWANFSHYKYISAELQEAPTLKEKLKVLFYKPGYDAKMAVYHAFPEVSRANYQKFDIVIPKPVNFYVLFQYIIMTAGALSFLIFQADMDLLSKGVIASLICLAVINFGWFFENKRWAYQLEIGRLLLTGIYAGFLMQTQSLFLVIIAGLLAISLIWLFWISHKQKIFKF